MTSWNEGARRLLGWTEEEMLGQTLERLFEDPGQIAREIQRGGEPRPRRR